MQPSETKWLHAWEWRRDVAKRGLGADNLAALMVAPYKRVVVLHLGIMGGGFAMLELGEPIVGLLMLVALKTGFDVYQSKKGTDSSHVSEKKMRLIEESMSEKKFTINGKEHQFDTFTEMTRSPHFETAMKFLRILVTKEELWMIEDLLYHKVAEERELAKRSPDGSQAAA
ncbi:MAG: DUF6498-containing protein [Gammaproteobacteria bacterium]|nr:DUF6498-containing protein [Gammaproteobacteria bacterium]